MQHLMLGTFTIPSCNAFNIYLMLWLGTFTILPVMQHLMLWLGTFTILPVMHLPCNNVWLCTFTILPPMKHLGTFTILL